MGVCCVQMLAPFMHTRLPDLLTKVLSSDSVEGCDGKPPQKEMLEVTIKHLNARQQRLTEEQTDVNPRTHSHQVAKPALSYGRLRVAVICLALNQPSRLNLPVAAFDAMVLDSKRFILGISSPVLNGTSGPSTRKRFHRLSLSNLRSSVSAVVLQLSLFTGLGVREGGSVSRPFQLTHELFSSKKNERCRLI